MRVEIQDISKQSINISKLKPYGFDLVGAMLMMLESKDITKQNY